MKLDPAIAQLLSLDPAKTTVTTHGSAGASGASTAKVTTTLPDGSSRSYFVKTGAGQAAKVMFEGEHASLSAIHTAVPTLCPASHGAGRLTITPDRYFLATDFLLPSDRSRSASAPSLAAKLAKLHTTPAPTPAGHEKPMFGFPVVTCCGETPQSNGFTASWADFYAEHRLRFILRRSEARNGIDGELGKMVHATADRVVPRLLGDGHLGGGDGVVPVVVHGDLWSGNEKGGVVFDSSACYAHSEYELGIMGMFGGFGRGFWDEYHRLVPRTPPVGEYEDRVRLYELYHHLNHHAMFGGGYRSGAVSIMKDLIRKYGGEDKP